MEKREDGDTAEGPNRTRPGPEGRKRRLITAVAVGLTLLIVTTVTAVLLTQTSRGSVDPPHSFSTSGDMLDFLVHLGEITKPDGLLATWFHRANSKEAMNEALAGDAMILEADVTLEGYGTPSEKPIPIMAHPPDVYSDNTLDQWLDAVLASRKGLKLDFKTLDSVGLSLELLSVKNSSRGINRPVWINADVLHGPNVPGFVPVVNGTRFLQIIQEKFPDVTLSPGWKVVYAPPPFTQSYSRPMVEGMYDLIKDAPQTVTFPVHALLVRRGWQHISWLLSQSPRFSLTLWQGSVHPNVSDLLFVRDNAHPARVYYDIYEPTLSAFKQAARQRARLRRFYPGGDLMDFLGVPPAETQRNSLSVAWVRVTGRASLLAQLSDGAGGMLVVHVAPDPVRPGVPVVEGSGESWDPLTLQDVLLLLGRDARPRWGLYLRVRGQQLLDTSLELLHSAYSAERLYRPVWISMEGPRSSDHTQEFVSAVERLFPYVTLVLTEPARVPAAVTGVSQRVALRVNHTSLPPLMGGVEGYDLLVEARRDGHAEDFTVLEGHVTQGRGRASTHLYRYSPD